MKRRILIVLALAIPLALFLVARNAVNWRPKSIASDSAHAQLLNSPVRSPSGRWIVFHRLQNQLLWDRQNPAKELDIGDGKAYFSRDETWMATLNRPISNGDTFIETVTGQFKNLKDGRIISLEQVKCNGQEQSHFTDGMFSADNRFFSALDATLLLRWDVESGKLVSKESNFRHGYQFLGR